MKQLQPRITAALLSAMLLIAFSSCRKDLCYNHFPVADIVLDYEQVWERDYGMDWPSNWDAESHGSYDDLRPEKPEGVTMVAYTPEGISNFFLSADGGDITFGSDVQSLMFYNNDTEYLIFNDIASIVSARATTTTRSRASFSPLHANERTINAPDVLYGAFSPSVPLIEIHKRVPLNVRLQPLVYTYVIHYEFEHGREHVALARGGMAGMAESVYLRDGTTSDKAATILYDCTLTPYGARADVASFGVPGFPDEYYGEGPARAPRSYTLNLEVRLTNGTIKDFNFDITDQMQRQPRGGVITVTGIRVEDDENMSDSGFDASIDDWGELEDIDVPLNSQNY